MFFNHLKNNFNKLEKIHIKKFVNLSKEEFHRLVNRSISIEKNSEELLGLKDEIKKAKLNSNKTEEVFFDCKEISLKNMDITDKVYKNNYIIKC